MSIQTELTRITNAKAAIKAAIEGKGVTVPDGTLLDGMASLIESIEAGGSSNFATDNFTPETDISCSAQNPFVVQHNLGRIPKAFFMYVSSRGVWDSDSYNILFAFGFKINTNEKPTDITTGLYSNDSANDKLKNAVIAYGSAYKSNKTLQTARVSQSNNCISLFGATEETINMTYATSSGGLKGGWTYTWIAV